MLGIILIRVISVAFVINILSYHDHNNNDNKEVDDNDDEVRASAITPLLPLRINDISHCYPCVQATARDERRRWRR
jgi:hypothetical protein